MIERAFMVATVLRSCCHLDFDNVLVVDLSARLKL